MIPTIHPAGGSRTPFPSLRTPCGTGGACKKTTGAARRQRPKPGGGGGNRTPVPRQFSGSIYVCSPSFVSRPVGLRWTGCFGAQPELDFPPRRVGPTPQGSLLSVVRRAPQARPVGRGRRIRRPERTEVRHLRFCARCFTRPPGHLDTQPPPLSARSNPFAPGQSRGFGAVGHFGVAPGGLYYDTTSGRRVKRSPGPAPRSVPPRAGVGRPRPLRHARPGSSGAPAGWRRRWRRRSGGRRASQLTALRRG